MKITFLGAADSVTGSRHLLDLGEQRILLDCGLFQGYKALRERNWAGLGAAAASIDAVLLSHAHLDHSGYIPALRRQGFNGQIFSSGATRDLCEVLLLDTRNKFEVDVGTFDNALELNLKSFSEMSATLGMIDEKWKNLPVVSFCTGGIRCEKAAPLLMHEGFRDVYQLDGGILKYFEKCGGAHYHGECFVFDKRVALSPDLAPSGMAQCYACQAVLTPEEQTSPDYVFGEHCPYCAQRNAGEKIAA